jgi:hypothetical protein
LLDSRCMARWKRRNGMCCEVHSVDAREGGSLRIPLTYDGLTRPGKTSGGSHTYHGASSRCCRTGRWWRWTSSKPMSPHCTGEVAITIALHNETGWRKDSKLATLVQSGG